MTLGFFPDGSAVATLEHGNDASATRARAWVVRLRQRIVMPSVFVTAAEPGPGSGCPTSARSQTCVCAMPKLEARRALKEGTPAGLGASWRSRGRRFESSGMWCFRM